MECGFGRVVPVFFSDHDLVHFKISVAGPTFGPGYWRLVGLRGLYEGVVEWWEGAKARVRTFCSRYCRRKAQRERKEVMWLQRLMEVEHATANWGTAVNQQACDGLKVRLRAAYETRARSFLRRSCDEQVEQNEKCSAGFFKSAQRRKARQVFVGVRDPRGLVVTDSGAMVREASAYFKAFFEEREVEEQ